MNILYLCGSKPSLGYTMRRWLDMNRHMIADFDRNSRVAWMKSGYSVYFHTYDRPDYLRGVEFALVFEDGESVSGPYQLVEETREMVQSRLRQAAGPVTLKTPPAY